MSEEGTTSTAQEDPEEILRKLTELSYPTETTRPVPEDAHEPLTEFIKNLFPEGINRYGSEITETFHDPDAVPQEQVNALKTALGFPTETKVYLKVDKKSMVNYGEISYSLSTSRSAPLYLLKLKEDGAFSITTHR